MREELEFSPLQPILFLIGSPAIYYIFSVRRDWFHWTNIWLLIILTSPLLLFIWKQLRITFLMLFQKPAVILTEESITITERSYTILWKDIMDIYMANDGSPGGGTTAPKNRYIIISVREPEKYIKAIKNPFTRYYRWYTRGFWSYSPFEVNLFLVKGDDDDIYELVLKYYQNLRGF
jgi:hypothetical protein